MRDGIEFVRRAIVTAIRHGVAVAPVATCLLALGTPAMGQSGVSSSGVDPRRQSHTSKVASEIETREPEGSVSDEGRVHDAYQPKGVELGSFLLLPDVSIGEAYNSNVFAAEDARGDFITRINPTFKLRSRFDRHLLNFSGDFEQLFYRRYDDDNQFNAQLSADGRLDIGTASEVTAYLTAFRQHEDRASPDAANGEEPTPYNGIEGRLGGKTVEGRWVFSVNGLHRTLDYEDVDTASGTTISNDGRDRSVHELTGRTAYEMFPGYFAVAQLTANRRDYHETVNAGGVDRDSSGYAGEVGVGVDLSRLIRGDFLVGYFQQDYEDSTLDDPSGLSLQSVFNWTPSRLTLVVASLKREVVETTNATASSIVRNGTSFLVRHELQRNVILSAFGSVNFDEYEGVDGNSWTYEARGSVTYVFNPNVYTAAELSYRQRDADAAVANSYEQAVASVRLGFRM